MSKKRFLTVFHYIALTAMLNSSFVAPAQGIITAFIDKHNFSDLWNRKMSSDGTGYSTIADNTENTVSTPKPQPLNNVRDQRITLKEFKSNDREAFIGTSKDQPFDNPADNIFRIQINRIPDSNTKAILTYDIYGIDANTAVARSINDRMSVGGYMIKTNSQWDTHTEAINPTWLRQGENTVLFTIPQGAGYNYKVKNVRISFQAIDRLEKNETIVIQNTVKTTQEDKFYIKGFVKNGAPGTKIIVGNSVLETEDGEFEAIINFTGEMKASGKVSVKTIDSKGVAARKLVDLNATPNVENVIAIKDKIHGTSKYFKRYASGDLTYDGVTIAIKDSAVVKNTTISVRRLRGVDIAPLGQGMINVTKGGSAYRFLPDGTKFKKDVELSIPYDTLRIPSGYTSKDIRTFYFDVHSRKWTVTKKLSEDKKSRTITSLTNHFTDYINGIIQSPESPETAAFAPTMMSDLKAADPSAEMGIIAPPSPSQKGDGTISYPLHIPSGRKGMQPSLELQYNNTNTSNVGYGLGWSLDTPSISIDTRWGIPTFDNANETELYSLNGSMLMYPDGYLPHRHQVDSSNHYVFNAQSRSSNLNSNGNKTFTPRNKSSFTRIERIGNSPSSYYWKVTGTDGTIYWYGGYENLEPNAIVKDPNGNIVHWALFKVIDVYGNTIKYVYSSRTITQNSSEAPNRPGLVGSTSFYLDSILYTGKTGNEFYPYRITFIRSSSIRPDFTINTKYGFKWVNPYSITSITVNYDNDIIRAYNFTFITGKFSKQLLSEISVEDPDHQQFYSHKFEYYDEVGNERSNYFGDTKTISIPSLTANFSLGLGNGNVLNSSRIFSSQNSEIGFSIKPTVGLEIGPKPTQKYKKTILVGAPFGQSYGKSRGKISLMDIDGDGLEDVVFRDQDGLRYLPGQLGTNGLSFSDQTKNIIGINEFSYSKTKTSTIFGDSWDLQFNSFFAGTQRTKSKSETKIYMIDANADGLVDVVNNGVVVFNSINQTSGEPSFSSSSSNTPNMVLRTVAPGASEPPETVREQEEDITTPTFNDKYDLVRVWIAPTTGYISINNKLNNLGPGTAPFTIELHHNNDIRLVYSTTLVDRFFGNEVSTYMNSHEPISVDKGDRLYFRFYTNETGENPVIDTYHVIRYLQARLPYGTVDSPELLEYTSQSAIHSSTDKPVEIPGSGTVSITWPTMVQHGYQSSGIRFKIYKRTTDTQGNTTDEVIYPDPAGNPNDGFCAYGVDTTVVPSPNLSNIAISGDNVSLIFSVEGNISILNRGVSGGGGSELGLYWRPKLTYTPDASAIANEVYPMQTYVVPNYTTYRKVDYVGKYRLLQSATDPTNPQWTTPTTQETYGIKPNTQITNPGHLLTTDNGSFILSYHNQSEEYASRRVDIVNGQIILQDPTPISYCTNCIAGNDIATAQKFEFSYFVDSKNIDVFEHYRLAVDNNTAIMGFGNWNNPGNTTTTQMVSINYKGDYPQLGQLLNEWGQFMYNDAFDPATSTPNGPFGKLINDRIVRDPFSTIDFSNITLLNSDCDSSAPDYSACLEQHMASALGIPAEGADMSTYLNSFSTLQQNADALNLSFNFPFLNMEVKRQDYDSRNDRIYGFYNSQYIEAFKLRAGNREESTASMGTNPGGAGLSYPELDTEPEPQTVDGDADTGMMAINKIHRSSSRSYTLGYGPLSVGTTNSSYSNSVTDFVDFNGDGYPDILTRDELQKTNSLGGHQPSEIISVDGNPLEQENKNIGLTASRTFRIAGRKPANSSSKVGKVSAPASANSTTGNSNSTQVTEVHSHECPIHSTDQGGDHVSLGIGVGVNVNLAGNDKSLRYWTDINGDGLPDRVHTVVNRSESPSVIEVTYNRGQSEFRDNQGETFPEFTRNPASKPTTISPSVNFGPDFEDILETAGLDLSFSAKLGMSASGSSTETLFIDINGDGLTDIQQGVNIMINTGNSFVDGLDGKDLNSDSHSEAFCILGTIGAYLGYPIATGLYLKGGFTFDAHSNLGIGQTDKSYKDLNADGYPDFINYKGLPFANDGTIKVNYSIIGRTNMLKTVHNPLGGNFTMDYAAQKTSYSNPHPRWALVSVVVNDGYDNVNDGEDSYKVSYSYENGYYDRREREFYGYEKVITSRSVTSVFTDPLLGQTVVSRPYSYSVSLFHNKNYFLRGLLKEQYTTNNNITKIYTRTVNTYSLKSIAQDGTINIASSLTDQFDTGGTEGRKSACVLLTGTTSYNYELGTTPLVSSISMEYDNLARVKKYIYQGDPGNTDDDYYTEIDYHESPALTENNLIELPQEVRVKLANGTLMRKRSTTLMDETTGAFETVHAYINDSSEAVTSMKYDEYGNVTQVTLPLNDDGMQMYYAYEYDADVHKYVVTTRDALGYTSSASYAPQFDKILTTADITGNIVSYTYDSFGRLINVLGPKEREAGVLYTIKMEYYPTRQSLESGMPCTQNASGTFMPVAVTKHYDTQHPDNDIETYTISDGLGRPVQIKKDIEMNVGDSFSRPRLQEQMSVSGKISYDLFGRAVRSYHPWYEDKDCAVNAFINEYDSPYFSTTDYDRADRAVVTKDPEDNTTTVTYSISNGLMKVRSVTEQNDSVNIVSESYTNVNGRAVSTLNVGPAGNIITTFNYNAIGELLSVTDAQGLSTIYTYDLLGRKTSVNHPDAGVTTYAYAPCGSITDVVTANMAQQQQAIHYRYEYNRLFSISFPQIAGEENIATVNYEYGDANAGNNAGRLIRQTDATGQQTFEYGIMGEVIHNERTIVGPNIPTRTFTTEFTYDTWNRIQTIKYPDGENVNYSYNVGGNLVAVEGNIQGTPYQYVSRIDYDHYGQRTYVKYGNNTETFYNYTSTLRRLDTMKAKTSDSQLLFENKYTYDKVGNVLGITNQAHPNSINALGGKFEHNYAYDNLNRLIEADGYFSGDDHQLENHNDASADYYISMGYNNTHGIEHKNQTHNKNNDVETRNTYENTYKYFQGTHRLKSIINDSTGVEDTYSYDLNGNMTRWNSENGDRRQYWDEVNRLRVVQDDHTMQHSIYDANGERVLKATSDIESIYQNGTLTNQNASLEPYTIYPSGYIVVKGNGEYTKHYYTGSQRVVSRIGTEDIDHFAPSNDLPELRSAKKFDAEKLRQRQIKDLINILKNSGMTPSFKKYKKENKEDNDESVNDEIGTTKNADNAERPIADAATAAPVVPQQFPYNSIYFYHPDHLGTSTYLTDANGMPYQFFINLPFGETMAEQHSLTEDYETLYKFNGKELDTETGYYYYGARYYEPRASIWLSVDPLAEKYPGINPYVYCMQNPINLVDPTGMAPKDVITVDKNGKIINVANNGTSAITIVDAHGNRFKPSTLNAYDRSHLQIMANIGGYYARQLGISSKYKMGASGKKLKEDTLANALAYTSGANNVAYFNGNGGTFNALLDDANNLKSVIRHEHDHQKANEKQANSDLSTHADIYINQMSKFTSETEDFKIKIASSAANYILNMDKNLSFNTNEITDKIDSFNNTNSGFILTYQNPNGSTYPKGELHLMLHYKGKNYDVNKAYKKQDH